MLYAISTALAGSQCTNNPHVCMLVMQLMFLCGVALTIGPQATVKFFLRKKNLKVG